MYASTHHMYRNMLFLTLRFMDTGLPSSYSTPLSPPSPERPRNFSCSSWSSSACVFFLGFGSSEGLVVDFCGL
jgi:hypothetical protein